MFENHLVEVDFHRVEEDLTGTKIKVLRIETLLMMMAEISVDDSTISKIMMGLDRIMAEAALINAAVVEEDSTISRISRMVENHLVEEAVLILMTISRICRMVRSHLVEIEVVSTHTKIAVSLMAKTHLVEEAVLILMTIAAFLMAKTHLVEAFHYVEEAVLILMDRTHHVEIEVVSTHMKIAVSPVVNSMMAMYLVQVSFQKLVLSTRFSKTTKLSKISTRNCIRMTW
jgi:hypothetical protein